MTMSNSDGLGSPSQSERVEGLLPAFSAKQYSHLPTPQSPSNLGRYLHERPHSPETPVPPGSSTSLSSAFHGQRAGNRRSDIEDGAMRLHAKSTQCATPESSPHFSQSTPLSYNNSTNPRYLFTSSSTEFSTPRQSSSAVKLESPTTISASATLTARTPPPSSPPSERSVNLSVLSSPFMGRLSFDDEHTDKNRASSRLGEIDDVFSSQRRVHGRQQPVVISTPPLSPPRDTSVLVPGGEMDRIRQAMLEDRLSQIQEAEKHRPEYLKRAKRTLSEADPNYLEEDDHGRERTLPVGIMESPHKGRRLKLFQETSDESFEESLMAGGYGRYRTADWVRQPQPTSLPPSAIAGSSAVVSILEDTEEAPPTQKELKKRKRLAAFRSEPTTANSKLCAVELEGKGRVLIDVPIGEQNIATGSPEPTPSKRKNASRRKKKTGEGSGDKKLLDPSGSTEDRSEKPNWPDAEFPWRLRTEERIELAKAEEDERLRWIERFLDRDSDDEEEPSPTPQAFGEQLDDRSTWAKLYGQGSEQRFQVTMGRGKMVPLPVPSNNSTQPIIRRHFPTDPGDALAALLSKKSVRTLSYRQQKRKRGAADDEEDEEVVCICNGKDDGRQLVQCDACQTWYHLQCIGIKNIAELGREEDPWFCRRCVSRSRSPSLEPSGLLPSEPTFVPTDDQPSGRRSSDTPFFHPSIQESPNWAYSRIPRTPTRGTYNPPEATQPWPFRMDVSRHAPSTPSQPPLAVRIYSSTTTPGPVDGYNPIIYDESPFDPTSTPSRGIEFHAPFATPKYNGWPSRSNGLFQTPSKSTGRGRNSGHFSMHSGSFEDSGVNMSAADHIARATPYDESPIRRNNGPTSRHRPHSPSRPHTSLSASSLLQESPVMRSGESQFQGIYNQGSRYHDKGL